MLFRHKTDITYVDMHCHLMPGVDDGSPDEATTEAMLKYAYADGIRTICLTPHIRRPWLHREPGALERGLEQVQAMAKQISPDLRVLLGCEFMYSDHVLQKYDDQLLGMNGTNYLLVEFDPSDSWNTIREGLNTMIQRGWDPILAHMERYHCVAEHLDYARQLYEMGIYLQVNANSIVNKRSPMWKTFVIPALEQHLVHFVSSDAHDLKGRCPELSKAATIVTKTCDAKYANKIFCQNALDMLAGEMI